MKKWGKVAFLVEISDKVPELYLQTQGEDQVWDYWTFNPRNQYDL